MNFASSAGASISSGSFRRVVRDAPQRDHRADSVDVTGHQVAAQPVGEAQRHLPR
jgi:hypothetical protein